MSSFDVAIIGAGPAGSAAARLLSSWGRRVVLIHRAPGSAAALAESIPPSCRKLFHACGVLEAVDAAGFYRSTGNTVWWGSPEPRREPFPDGALGYQVDRPVFDELLRREAVRAGAELREAIVRDVRLEADGRARIAADADVIYSRFVLDCSGRAGVVARPRWRIDVAGHPRTVALVASWSHAAPLPDVDPTHTLVESYDDGWAWSVPVSPERRFVTAMVDPQRTRLARGRPALDVYQAELAKTSRLLQLLRDATLERTPWGCDASVYAARTYAQAPLLLVGDAASFIDPLSSFGIKKALASAWLASVAVNTALETPEMTDASLSFFAARESEMAASLLRQSRAQFEAAAAEHAHAFWVDRVDVDLPDAAEPDVHLLRNDPRVRQAFEWLKAQPAVTLRAGATVRREPQPVVRNRLIVMEQRLVADEAPRGFRFLRDVDVIELLALAPDHDQVPALFEAYNRRNPPVALPDFLGALSVMLAFGILEQAPDSVMGNRLGTLDT